MKQIVTSDLVWGIRERARCHKNLKSISKHDSFWLSSGCPAIQHLGLRPEVRTGLKPGRLCVLTRRPSLPELLKAGWQQAHKHGSPREAPAAQSLLADKDLLLQILFVLI